MDEQLIALYHRHVGMAFDRQQRLGEFLDRKGATGEFEYDPSTATLAVGKLAFEAPILGTHDHTHNTWLWAASNKKLKLTLTNRALGDAVRALVHRLGVHPLGAPSFALEPLLGPGLVPVAAHMIGVILAGELGYDVYYTLPGDVSTELLLIRDARLKAAEKHPLARVAATFRGLSRAMPVFDEKAALAAYARDYNLTVEDAPHELKVTDGKDTLTATFDENSRLATFEGIELPAPVKVKKAAARKPTARKPPAKKLAAEEPVAKVVKPAAKKPAVKPAAKKAPTASKPVAKKPSAKK